MQILPENLILPARMLNGRGSSAKLVTECARFGAHGMLVHGRTLRTNGIIPALTAHIPQGLEVSTWEHKGGEPTLGQVEELLKEAKKRQLDWICAIGGGSVLDLAKAAAGLFHSEESVETYHDGKPVQTPGIPFIAAPTTAGTGSETTMVTVLTSHRTGTKKSIRHPSFMARVVILDPALLADSPAPVIAHSGMDAFVQGVESYLSSKSSWLSDTLALKGLELVSASLETVYSDPASEAAEPLLFGSCMIGIAFSFSRLGLAHGLAHPLGARYRLPHGLVCAVCLPHVIEFNRHSVKERYHLLGKTLGTDLLERTYELIEHLQIRSPFAGKQLMEKDGIINETMASGSTAANPRPVTAADVENLLNRIFTQ